MFFISIISTWSLFKPLILYQNSHSYSALSFLIKSDDFVFFKMIENLINQIIHLFFYMFFELTEHLLTYSCICLYVSALISSNILTFWLLFLCLELPPVQVTWDQLLGVRHFLKHLIALFSHNSYDSCWIFWISWAISSATITDICLESGFLPILCPWLCVWFSSYSTFLKQKDCPLTLNVKRV